MVTQVVASRIQAAVREAGSMRENGAATPAAEAQQKNPATAAVPGRAGTGTIPRIDAGELQSAVKEIANSVRLVQRSLQFSVDEASGRTVITVIDKETDEVIREIPPEEVLAIARRLEEISGLFVLETA